MSTYDKLADLTVTVEGYELEPLSQKTATFERHTTQIRLRGAGEEGVGEEISYDAADHAALQKTGPSLSLAGSCTLAEFSDNLATLDLFVREPQPWTPRQYRTWAFESAALDLALRQAGRSLAEQLGIEPVPVRFAVSMGLGHPPSSDRVLAWLEHYPGMHFKLDANSAWDDAFVERLAAGVAVDVIDLKGAYRGTPVDGKADPALYARLARAFPDTWLEDPALTPETVPVLADYRDRISWDAPINSVDDVLALDVKPRTLNIKPSRFGSLRALCAVYDHCAAEGIAMYGGGQFELGCGRDQIQYLASLFHPEGCNDVAPRGFNVGDPRPGLPASPLDPSIAATGFRREAG